MELLRLSHDVTESFTVRWHIRYKGLEIEVHDTCLKKSKEANVSKEQ